MAAETVTAAIGNTHWRDNLVDLDARVEGGLLKGLFVSTTSVGTDADTAEKDLWSQTLVADQLSTDTDRLIVTASGDADTASTTHQIRVYLGTTVVWDSTAFDFFSNAGTGDWHLDVSIWRVDGTNQKIGGTMLIGHANANAAQYSQYTTATETLSGALVCKVTGQNGSSQVDGVRFQAGSMTYAQAP